MPKPTVLILRAAGINCDKETELAFQKAGAKTELKHINLIKREKKLNYQVICFPGGFSYGDDLGAGKILSLEIKLWLRDKLNIFIQKGGLLLGICNGFQVLVRLGLLPDLSLGQRAALIKNDSKRFESRWVQLAVGHSAHSLAKKIWLRDLPEFFYLPVAHAEGKFYCSSQALESIKKNNQVALRYAGQKNKKPAYPDNPNGSLENIAALVDKSGKILGLMPHPERFIFSHQHPYWLKKEAKAYGFYFFKNAVNYFK